MLRLLSVIAFGLALLVPSLSFSSPHQQEMADQSSYQTQKRVIGEVDGLANKAKLWEALANHPHSKRFKLAAACLQNASDCWRIAGEKISCLRCASASLAAHPSDSVRSRDLCEIAFYDFQAKHYESAMKKYQEASDADSENQTALTGVADCKNALGRKSAGR